MSFESDKPCIICGQNQPKMVTYHHVYRRKTYPEHEWKTWNLMPLCLKHHNEIHATSNRLFASKHRQAQKWFDDNGWEVKLSGQYFHPIDLDENNS
jgi:5-methylcytosine-specific restriction endonuclease McrA